MSLEQIDSNGKFNWEHYDRNGVLARLRRESGGFLNTPTPAEEIYKFFDNEVGVGKRLDKERQLNLLAAIPYPGKRVCYYIWYICSSEIEGYIFAYLNAEINQEITYTYFNFYNGRIILIDSCKAVTSCIEGTLSGYESDIGIPAKAGILSDVFEFSGLNSIDSSDFKNILGLETIMYMWDATFQIAKYEDGIDGFSKIIGHINDLLRDDYKYHKDRENFILMVGRTFGSGWTSIANLIYINYKLKEKTKSLTEKASEKIFGFVETETPKVQTKPEEVEAFKKAEDMNNLVIEQTTKRIKMNKPLLEDIIHEIMIPSGKTKEIYKVKVPHIQIIKIDTESESNCNDIAMWNWESEDSEFTSDGNGLIVGNHCYLIDFSYNDIWYTNLSEDKRNEYTKVPVEFNYQLLDDLFDLAYRKYKDDNESEFDIDTIILSIVNALSENLDSKFYNGPDPVYNYVSNISTKLQIKVQEAIKQMMEENNPIRLD